MRVEVRSSAAPRRAAWTMAALVAVGLGAAAARAQEKPAALPSTTDPRASLKAGIKDAGTAAKNMTLVSSLSKPAGFFDPKNPAGDPTPPERPAGAPPAAAPAAGPATAPAGGAAAVAGAAATAPRPGGGLDFANSDLAFKGVNVVMGNFHGFNTYNVEDARKPKLVASIACPGGQGDVSIYGNLLFMSVEQTRGRIDCGTQGVATPVSVERFRGVRIFDITDLKNPKQVAAVQTCRGSHTHTLVPAKNDPSHIYVYGSGTGNVRSGEELAGLLGPRPEGRSEHRALQHRRHQGAAEESGEGAIVARPRIFADATTGAIAGLWPGGDHGPGTQRTSTTNQCHDITVMPDVGLAAGACSGNGILMDISNPEAPTRLDFVADNNFAYWHSATFNNDGTKVIFTDEWGGGTRPRCRATDSLTWGANAIFDIVDKKLVFKGYYKLPAAQTETENCVAHNGSLVPVPGRDIMVQGWYQGGISVFDFTDSAQPVEIAYFDRGPLDAEEPHHRRLLVGLLVQRQHLRRRDRPRHRRLQADAERVPERERAGGGQPGALRGVQLAEPAGGHLAAELHRRQGLHRPARTRSRHRPGTGQGPQDRLRPGRQAAANRAGRARRHGGRAREGSGGRRRQGPSALPGAGRGHKGTDGAPALTNSSVSAPRAVSGATGPRAWYVQRHTEGDGR